MFEHTGFNVISRRLNHVTSPLRIRGLEAHLPDLDFEVTEDGTHYSKAYASRDARLIIRVICAGDVLCDVLADLVVDGRVPFGPIVAQAEEIFGRNMAVIASLTKMSRHAQTANVGNPGGSGGLTGMNVDESIGGPRWWLYEDQKDDVNGLEKWIQEQNRYNPDYMPVGEALEDKEDKMHVVADVPGNVAKARLVPNRQEVTLQYVLEGEGQPRTAPLPKNFGGGAATRADGDLAQEVGKYEVKMIRTGKSTLIALKKVDARGDVKGIWEINGKPSTPGYAYVDEDGRTSYSLHPELLDDPGWTSGDHSVGRAGYGYPD